MHFGSETQDRNLNYHTDAISLTLEDDPLVLESGHQARPNLSFTNVLLLNIFWLGYQFFFFIVTIILLPKQVQEIVGDEWKGIGLAVVGFVSGFFNLFLAVSFGALNDKFHSPYGKRRPWMLVGSIGMCLGLFGMWPTDSLAIYTLAYLILTISSIFSSVPFNGLIADSAPPSQTGFVSSVMGSMNLVGYLIAAIVGALVDPTAPVLLYIAMSTVLLGTTSLTMLSVSEPKSEKTYHDAIVWRTFFRDLVKPLYTHKNFRLVFLGRFLAQLGIATVQQYLQYWIADCITDSGMAPSKAVSVAMLPLLTLSPIAALFIPKNKRKIVVYVSTGLMVLTCILMMFVQTYIPALITSAIFGLGYGPYVSCEFAMLLDVLPPGENVAKDISLWHSAIVLPQIVATSMAGWIRDVFQKVGKENDMPRLGYQILFGVCILYFVSGAEMTRRIRGMP